MRRARTLFALTLGVATFACGSDPSADRSSTALEAACAAVTRDGVHYLFCSSAMPYEQAADACRASGLALVTIDNEAENAFVAARAPAAAYIGLSDREYEGAWRWEADRRVTWCGAADGRRENPGAFARWSPGAPGTANCQFRSHAGRDYWLCADELSWADARDVCQSAGSDLAAINDAAESTFLAPEIRRTSWIGGQASGASWSWAATSQVFWGAGAAAGTYANWASGAPRRGAGDGCLLVSNGSSARWHSAPCDRAQAFVCEAPTSRYPDGSGSIGTG